MMVVVVMVVVVVVGTGSERHEREDVTQGKEDEMGNERVVEREEVHWTR